MRQLYIAGCMLIIVCTCQAQNAHQQERIRNFFYNVGYKYLEMAHITSDAKRVTVYFSTDYNTVRVDINFEGIFGDRFVCQYYFDWSGSRFSNLSWTCGVKGFQCWEGCNFSKEILVAMIKQYLQAHPGTNTDEQVVQQLEKIFNKQLGQLSCSELCFGFILLEWYGYSG